MSTSRGQDLLADRAGAANVARHLVRAAAGITLAFLTTRLAASTWFDAAPLSNDRLIVESAVAASIALIGLFITSAIPIRNDMLGIRSVVAGNEAELNDRNEGQRFLRDVQQAFDMAEIEAELCDIAGLAMRDAGPGRAEILVADSSNAHVRRVAVSTDRGAPGCGVVTPHSCPAVRHGHTLRFGDANGLSACPRLRERGFEAGHVATCIPINVLGTPSAVLHAVCGHSEVADLDAGVRSLEGVAVQFGARLGMMRAMAQSRHQADTDPLTGLLNRRSMENRVRDLRHDSVPFALAMVDLDHFKDLNDTFGHDTGDRALRLWSRVAMNALRDDDMVARHGGEEFVIVLPGTDIDTAAPVIHRLRERLRDALADAQLPEFTFSAGLVDSTWCEDLPGLLAAADRALLDAKTAGRDQLIIDDPTRPISRQDAADHARAESI